MKSLALRSPFALLAVLAAVPALAQVGPVPMSKEAADLRYAQVYRPEAYGAKANGTTDDSAAIQAAVNAASARGGGYVFCSARRYGVSHVDLKPGVYVRGMSVYNQSAAGSVFGAGGSTLPGTYGTTFYVLTAPGAQQANGTAVEDARPATISQAPGVENCGIDGVDFYWPGQNAAAQGNPYAFPWAVKLQANNGSVTNCQLVNAYQGIWCDGQRQIVRNVDGQVFSIGFRVDNSADIVRVENVHWNPFNSFQSAGTNTGMFTWQCNNGIGFQCLRADGLQMLQCFAYGEKVGLEFGSSAPNSAQYATGTGGRSLGASYGTAVGCDMDLCQIPLHVVQTQSPQGMHLTGFLGVATQTNPGGTGVQGTGIGVDGTFTGTLTLSQGAIFGACQQGVNMGGTGVVTLVTMNFDGWASGNFCIGVGAGTVDVTDCTFLKAGTAGQMNSLGSARCLAKGNKIRGTIAFNTANAPGSGDGKDVIANNTTLLP